MIRIAKWAGAIFLSLLAHVGAAALLTPADDPPEATMIAGGEAVEVTLLGNAFEDALQAGTPEDPVQPADIPPENIAPDTVATVKALSTLSDIVPQTPMDIVPTKADVIVPAEAMPTVTAVDPAVAATTAPIDIAVTEDRPEQRLNAVQPAPVGSEKIETVDAEKPKPQKPEPQKKTQPEKKPAKKKSVRTTAGDTGQSRASQQKGQADGAETAKTSAASGKAGATAREAGNAKVSNNGGKVRSKLSRAQRYPPAAKRGKLRGTAKVRFIVLANGSVSSAEIVASSGSPILDQAALDTIRRASPFPKLADAETFTIPLEFNP